MPIYSLSRELIQAIALEYPDLEALNLSDNCVSTIENLQPLTALTKLNLASNALAVAGGLEQLTCLQELQLQKNRIEYVSPQLSSLKALRVLDLSSNCLADVSSLVPILRCLPSLRHLSLQGNPCCAQPDYAVQVLSACPNLHSLDGVARGAAAAPPSAPPAPAPTEERQPLTEVENAPRTVAAIGPVKPVPPTVEEPGPYLPQELGPPQGAASPLPPPLLERQAPKPHDGQACQQSTARVTSCSPSGVSIDFMTLDSNRSSRAAPRAAELTGEATSSEVRSESSERLPASAAGSVAGPVAEPQCAGWWSGRTRAEELQQRLEASEREVTTLRTALDSAVQTTDRKRSSLMDCRAELDGAREDLRKHDSSPDGGCLPAVMAELLQRLQTAEREGAQLRAAVQSAEIVAESERAAATGSQAQLDAAREELRKRDAAIDGECGPAVVAELQKRLEDAGRERATLMLSRDAELAAAREELRKRDAATDSICSPATVLKLQQRLEDAEREGARLQTAMQAAELAAERERAASTDCRAELATTQELLREREAAAESLRAYVGAQRPSNKPTADAAAQVGGVEKAVETAAIAVSPVGDGASLLEAEVAALQEIIAVQEEQMARAASRGAPETSAAAAAGLLARWRQEVFDGILARKAAELRAREAESDMARQLSSMQERVKQAEYAAKVAEQKTVASSMELRRANAALAAAQKQAGAAGRSASNWERQAMESQRNAREMAAAARATDAAARALEGKLEGAGRLLAAFSRRVAFAEERLQVLQALAVRRPAPSAPQPASAPAPPALPLPLPLAADNCAEGELRRELDSLRAERKLLLARVEGHAAEVAAAVRGAEARAKAAAAVDTGAAVAGAVEGAEQRAVQREVEVRQELAAALEVKGAEVRRAEREREEAEEQLQAWKIESRAQQAELTSAASKLASCERALAKASEDLEAADAARADSEAEFARQLEDLKLRHRREAAAVQSRHEEDHRQGAKAIVTVRQLERQLARLHEKQAYSATAEIEALEQKLQEKDAALRAARRERNALLAEKRGAEAQRARQEGASERAPPAPAHAPCPSGSTGLRPPQSTSAARSEGSLALSAAPTVPPAAKLEPIQLDGAFTAVQRTNGSLAGADSGSGDRVSKFGSLASHAEAFLVELAKASHAHIGQNIGQLLSAWRCRFSMLINVAHADNVLGVLRVAEKDAAELAADLALGGLRRLLAYGAPF
eukprot:jgi/Tetstr1/434215/TSEL_023326.t1